MYGLLKKLQRYWTEIIAVATEDLRRLLLGTLVIMVVEGLILEAVKPIDSLAKVFVIFILAVTGIFVWAFLAVCWYTYFKDNFTGR